MGVDQDVTLHRLAQDLLAEARENDRAAYRVYDQLFGTCAKDEFPENCDDVISILAATLQLAIRTGRTLGDISLKIGSEEKNSAQISRSAPPSDVKEPNQFYRGKGLR